jgi:DNA polymerase-3 subunit alpha
MSFVHLHNHSEYSVLDGLMKISRMVRAAKDMGMPAIALTDHGVMYGAIEFYKEALTQGIKPILGCELYVLNGDMFDRSPAGRKPLHHLTALVKNNTGYRNLCRLVSLANLKEGGGFYYKPRVDKQRLAEHKEGLIFLSGCLQGEVPKALFSGDRSGAEKALRSYLEFLDPQDFYMELQDNGYEGQKGLNRDLAALAGEHGLETVATNDCHYLEYGEHSLQDVMICLATNKFLDDEDRLHAESDQLYLKSPEEMRKIFADFPRAIENTMKIAESVDLELEMGTHHFPELDLGTEYEGGNGKPDYDRKLREDVFAGLEWRLGDRVPEEYRERAEFELGVIGDMGYPSYFLIVADFINWAKNNGVAVGPGRGSVAGSLVAFALNITTLDPIRYNLLFERFLNPDRISLPDIDTDFHPVGRAKVIDYCARKYGRDRVCQIITFSKQQAKAAVRNVGRVMRLPLDTVDRICKSIPSMLTDEDEVEMARERGFLRAICEGGYLDEFLAENRVREVVEMAAAIEGLTRTESIHAGGVIISGLPIQQLAPVQEMKGGETVVQYDMNCCEDIGLVKMDFLGLSTLALIQDAVDLIRESRGIEVDVENLPLNDKRTFDFLCQGHTLGLFQIASDGLTRLLVKMQPHAFEEIIALIALYRPGVLKLGYQDHYVDRKFRREKIPEFHPVVQNILKDTYGVIVYQEQVLQIAQELAGFSRGKSDNLRKAIGKKNQQMIDQFREEFIQGAIENGGVTAERAAEIYDNFEAFGRYGFNKSHSAVYAMVAYQTAYLKANFTPEFMAALLTSEKDDLEKIGRILTHCRELGIKVLPPCVKNSKVHFTVDEGHIRFGLAGIKGVGGQAVKAVIKGREEFPDTEDFFTFLSHLDLRTVTRAVLEQLVRSGAMDSLSGNRMEKLGSLDKALEFARETQRDRISGQSRLFDGSGTNEGESAGIAFDPVKPVDKATLLLWEKEAAGFFLSGHPLDDYWKELSGKISHTTSEIANLHEGLRKVTCGGLITELRVMTDRNGNPYARMMLEDREGKIRCTCWNRNFKEAREVLESGSVVIASGRVEVESTGSEKEPLVEAGVLPEEMESVQEEPVRFSQTFFIDKAWSLSSAPRRRSDNFRRSKKGSEKQHIQRTSHAPLKTTSERDAEPSMQAATISEDEEFSVVSRRLDEHRTRSSLNELKVEMRNGNGGRMKLVFKGQKEEFIVELPQGYSPPQSSH